MKQDKATDVPLCLARANSMPPSESGDDAVKGAGGKLEDGPRGKRDCIAPVTAAGQHHCAHNYCDINRIRVLRQKLARARR
jgi:hypothetical protein